ncbi:MAG TPA: acetyl-CoA carboxylase biotin carboxyl carrier protein [Terriglobales bacterium]
MNPKELKELIEFLVEKDISEFELERGDIKLRVKRPSAQTIAPVVLPAPVMAAPAAVPVATAVAAPVQAAPAAAANAAPTPVPAQEEEAGLHTVKSPIVGTFYESPSPGSPPFVKPGDTVKAGQVLCIVEAMKLMNEIESEVSGEIVKCLVSNGQPVEYGQPLFAVRAR